MLLKDLEIELMGWGGFYFLFFVTLITWTQWIELKKMRDLSSEFCRDKRLFRRVNIKSSILESEATSVI